MQSLVLLATVAVAYFVYWCISGLRHNIAQAKKSDLPYIIAPCSPIFLPWQITHKLWIPLIKLLPKAWHEEWLGPLTPNFSYQSSHERFTCHGDTFFIVSPGMIVLMSCNAEANRQFTFRRDQFPKLTESYSILRQFGENVLASEGALWRVHRKVTSASFNEKNSALVFRESIRQAKGLVRTWTEPRGETNESINTLEVDTMRLALNIIAYVGFGLTLLWPGQALPDDADSRLVKYGSLEPSEGHKLSFVDTIAMLMEYIVMLLLVPRWLLRLIPSKITHLAADAHEDFNKYVQELMDEKIDEARRGEHVEGMDLMGQLVRSSYGVRNENKEADEALGHNDEKTLKAPSLSRSDIIGNTFVMLAAGHETTANALHFAMLLLATNPSSQRRLQKELDELVGDRDPNEWDYDTLINPMMGGMLGACLNETLRVLPAVVEIPKKVVPHQDQVISIDGHKHVLPKGAVILIAAIVIHRSPRYWPARPSKIRPGKDDIEDFVPERWFRTGETDGNSDAGEDNSNGDTEDFGGYSGRDTSAQLFRPERGSYIPFSDGPRSCLGRRVAQVEIIAVLAVLFRDYSLELAVDQWASDEDVERMTRDEKAKLYSTAQEHSRSILRDATSVITLKLHGGKHVPVRFVKRGNERFVNWVDGS